MRMDKEHPLVSVIIPIYNASQYLGKCLDSILHQSYRNTEILCVDDGSQDTSVLILQKYASLDNRIRIIEKENGGVVSARKKGIMEASGDYVFYVDADDWIDPNMLAEMVNAALENEAEIVTSGCVHEYDNHTTINSERFDPGRYSGESLRNNFLSNMVSTDVFFSQNVRVSLWGKLYRKGFLEPFQLQIDNSLRTGEDVAVVYPCYLNAKCVYVMGKNYYHYRINAHSMTSRGSGNADIHSLEILREFLEKEFSCRSDIQSIREQYEIIIAFEQLQVLPEEIVKLKDDELFPFSSVCSTDRLVLYGAGRFGKKLKRVIEDLGMSVVGLIDRNVSEGVLPLKKIKELNFDKIIISVLNFDMISDIKRSLCDEGIDEKQISTIDVKKIIEKY